MKKLLVLLTNTKLWNWLLIKIIPYIRFSLYYTSFKGKQFNEGLKLLKVGDILLSRDNKKMTTLLIGGTFTHAALCVGDNNSEYQIAEMTHTHFTKSWFFDVCKESDRVVILRCRDFDSAYIEKMVEKCKSFSDCKYDVEFDLGVKALYCAELIYHVDVERRLDIDLSDIEGLGRKYISPTGLYEANNCDVIYDSENYKS